MLSLFVILIYERAAVRPRFRRFGPPQAGWFKGFRGGKVDGASGPKVVAAFGGGLRSLALRGATALWAEGKVSPDGDEYEASVTGLPSHSFCMVRRMISVRIW